MIDVAEFLKSIAADTQENKELVEKMLNDLCPEEERPSISA